VPDDIAAGFDCESRLTRAIRKRSLSERERIELELVALVDQVPSFLEERVQAFLGRARRKNP
jgi:hypothetical protein